MAQLYDEQGNPVEAITQEELDTKIDEAKEAAILEVQETHTKEITDAREQIKNLTTEKKDLEEKLDPKNPKSANFKKTREAMDIKDDQIEALTKKVEELSDGLGKKIDEIQNTNKKSDIQKEILTAAGGDKELAKKVEVAYNRFGGAPASPEELTERIQDAMKLVTDDKGRPLINSNIINSSGGGKNVVKTGKVSDDVAEMATRNFGLSEAELKKAKLI